MRELQMLALLCITMAAVLFDLQKGRIPNGVIVTGLLLGGAHQLFAHKVVGVMLFLGGMLLPVLLFGALYFFRMIGAGDVKLMCVVGGFLGPSQCYSCIMAAIIFGGMIALVIMFRRRIFSQRLACFSEYVSRYSSDRRWVSYMDKARDDARFCFSVPVLLGILCHMGGII